MLPKGLSFTKQGTLKTSKLKNFQVRKKNSQHVIVIYIKTLKCFNKNCIKWLIEKTFIWGVINQHCIPSMSI